MKRIEILVVAAFAGFVLVGCDSNGASSVATEASMAADAAEAAAVPEIEEAQATADQAAAIADATSAEAPALTRVQQNAVRSAESYLMISGFSRDGLINQLSSDAGEGYDALDAKIAVDSLNVDWNEQAEKSAEQYLSMQGFSCKGLVEQLSSDAGDKYTKAQAEYGAREAGACG